MQETDDFAKTILKHQALLFKVSRIYVDNTEDQKDLFQEIVFQLYKSFQNFKGNSKVTTWMYRVAMNTAIAFLNKSKRQVTTITDFDFPEIIDEKDHAAQEQTDLMYQYIKKLNVIEKGIILLYLEGKNHEEISEITGFTKTNVGTRIGRIKQKLKETIRKKESWK
ncbi:DNA-directed RNA polymerase sigma-70 factor [Patiriisocius marinistellae]|uniref:DNA-directed RNA polymerase sigma-70 factor n=1 Tax=Patiriisocius marinistellae TaxID=2494560 RepID=A0A5J4FZ74_9FLAO|nr:RNA polymerase sigma factor [Patiriisocius marinistellae]GEQ86708.1 DNA-directed RNA polymerase sigma-70 factor [Patiriisocius marinistellae]